MAPIPARTNPFVITEHMRIRSIARERLHKACMARLLPQPFKTPRPLPLDTLRQAELDLHFIYLETYRWQDIRTRLGLA